MKNIGGTEGKYGSFKWHINFNIFEPVWTVESCVIRNFLSSLAISPWSTCGISMFPRPFSEAEMRGHLFWGRFLKLLVKKNFENINMKIVKNECHATYFMSGPKSDSIHGRNVLCKVWLPIGLCKFALTASRRAALTLCSFEPLGKVAVVDAIE